MKKKRSKPQKKAKQAARPPQSNAPDKPERRAVLSRTVQIVIGLAVGGGGSVFAVSAVRATARE